TPHIPTATMAMTWSGPSTGCARPEMKPPAPSPVWANAGAAAINRMRARNARLMRASLRRLLLLGDPHQPPQDEVGALEPLLGARPVVEEHDLHVGAHARRGAVVADIGDEPIRIGKLVVAEGEHSSLRPGLDLLDVRAPAQRLDGDDAQQVLHLLGQRPEAVGQ